MRPLVLNRWNDNEVVLVNPAAIAWCRPWLDYHIELDDDLAGTAIQFIGGTDNWMVVRQQINDMDALLRRQA